MYVKRKSFFPFTSFRINWIVVHLSPKAQANNCTSETISKTWLNTVKIWGRGKNDGSTVTSVGLLNMRKDLNVTCIPEGSYYKYLDTILQYNNRHISDKLKWQCFYMNWRHLVKAIDYLAQLFMNKWEKNERAKKKKKKKKSSTKQLVVAPTQKIIDA